ncbi:MAG: nickel-dependent lactate racemase [Succiniclasticum sp.]|uniref:nickel-dependent lactate racemase n=1 Tax=Succiniclasticum sp. TaxID=2775030 RepID=UPI002A915A99|nr:nickel-dependent lactate racemase [Succiniclasticum sp.]MDY6290253.1 nickel-dependent lactate racemase [Succiniclasticum sp.]
MKTYEFSYGKGMQTVDLPEEHIIYDLHGKEVSVEADIAAAALKALRDPIDSKPLADIVRPGDKIAIVVSDETRLCYTDQFLPVIITELNANGIPDSDIDIVIATGTHRAQTPEEDILVLGEEMVKRFRIHQHDCRDKENLVYKGTTSRGNKVYINKIVANADKIIATGAVTLHPMAGFGGGRKAIVPGVAGLETINHNHVLALAEKPGDGCSPNVTTAKLEGNPFHEDLTECVEFVNPDFLVDVVLTSDGGLYEVVAGNWKTAFYKGCKDLLEISGIPITELADVVIASGGGYPKDINLYQGTKTHMNVEMAVKPGGIAIIMLECPDIKEPAIFTDWLIKSNLRKTEQEVRDNFYMAAFVAYKSRCIIEAHTVYLVTRKENFDFVRQTGQIPVETVAEAWKLAQEKLAAEGKKDYTITLMGHAPVTLPVLTK